MSREAEKEHQIVILPECSDFIIDCFTSVYVEGVFYLFINHLRDLHVGTTDAKFLIRKIMFSELDAPSWLSPLFKLLISFIN